MSAAISKLRGSASKGILPTAYFSTSSSRFTRRSTWSRNLVENAVKHGSERGTVEVWRICEGRFVQIAVEDDGEGIAPARH
jgi:light-regulated signal transduction histidine kinase (bacteriophytochrome)